MPSRALICGLLVLAIGFVFAEAGDHPFIAFDDYSYIVENPVVHLGVSREGVTRAFTTPFQDTVDHDPYYANWHPLTTLSLQIDYALYGLEPGPYHVTNVVLHALASLALFLALTRLTGAMGRSAFAAAIFALHPLHVESVVWVSQRKDVLCGLWFALALYAYALHAERPRRGGPYVVVLVCGLLALLAKPVAVTLPFVLLLLDYWPLGRLDGETRRRLPEGRLLLRALLEKAPLFALSAAAAVVTLLAQRRGGAMDIGDLLPFWSRLANALVAYGSYLGDSFWPSGLAIFYPHPVRGIALTQGAFLAAASLVSVTAAFAWLADSRRYLIVGWLWFIGTLVPMIGLVQVGAQARADRYMYIPLIGLAIAVSWGAFDAGKRFRGSRTALPVAGVAAAVILAVTAHLQVRHWRDSVALFQHALSVTEGNWLIHDRLADVHVRAERIDEAMKHYRLAIEALPGWSQPRFSLADVLARRGDLEGAIASYQRGLEIEPDLPEVHARLGLALAIRGRGVEASRTLARAERLGADSPELSKGMAILAQQEGRLEAAVRHYRDALRGDPGDPAAANNLAWILATSEDPLLRDPDESVQLAEAALERSGHPTPALLDTLATSYAAAGRFAEAVTVAGQALELARASGKEGTPVAAGIRTRLELFRAASPYIEQR